MLAIRAYLLVDYQVNAEATPDSIPPAAGTRPALFAEVVARLAPAEILDGVERLLRRFA
jgi:hypothetical protein